MSSTILECFNLQRRSLVMVNNLPALYAAKKASAVNHKKTYCITVRPEVLLAHQFGQCSEGDA